MQENSFGYWLKRRRRALDLTQAELGSKVGCSAAAIRKIEAEERRPSAQIVERLAVIFGIPPSEQKGFLRFARGELRSAPTETQEDFPWQTSSRPVRSNLPATVTSLIGRQQEIALLRDHLLNPDIRLVTLIGPPGIGKTRLSIEAARTLLTDFPEGVFFVALAPLEDPSLLVSTVAQALDYVETKHQTAFEQLVDGIGDKQMLLVLDNCEHLINDVATLSTRLLSGCSRLKIMATSRESLRISGEWLYSVPTLDVPKDSSSLDVETASEFPALALFAERARAVRPDFALNSGNFQVVASICSQLDGLPLAIELIAARIRLMSPDSLLARMNNQFILSADGMRAVSPRQKTLQDAIAWSYDLLSNEEQKFFARLSVFSGGFTQEAAESIFSLKVADKSISDLIASLLDKSLLQRSLDKRDETRFNMLVTIQQFALNQLRQRNEEPEVRNWHLAYFLDLAEQSDKEIHGSDQVKWLDRLEAEHDNYRAVLDWCVSNKKTESALRLLGALGWTWMVQNHHSEMRSWFDQLRALPDIAAYPALYARLLNHMGRQAWLLGEFREARSVLREGQAIWPKLGFDGERGLAESLNYLGMVASSSQGDNKTAQSLYEQGLNLYQRHDDRWGMAFTLFNLGWIADERDEDALARSQFEQSLNLFRQLGDLWGLGRASQLLGQLFLKQWNYEKARHFFEQHLRLDESLHFKEGIAIALANLGNLYRYQSDYDQAQYYYEKSLSLCREYNLKIDRGYNLYCLSMLALHRNSYSLARPLFEDYYNSSREFAEKIVTAEFLMGRAAITAGMNEPEHAAKLLGAAQALFETTDYRIPRFDRAEFERHIQIAQKQLGETRFQALAAEGRAMTMEQAIAYALDDQAG